MDDNTIKKCNNCASEGLSYRLNNGRPQVMISENYMSEARDGMSYMQQASMLADMMANGELDLGELFPAADAEESAMHDEYSYSLGFAQNHDSGEVFGDVLFAAEETKEEKKARRRLRRFLEKFGIPYPGRQSHRVRPRRPGPNPYKLARYRDCMESVAHYYTQIQNELLEDIAKCSLLHPQGGPQFQACVAAAHVRWRERMGSYVSQVEGCRKFLE